MGLGAKTQTVSRGSQATPLAELVLGRLAGQIQNEGNLGKGVSPLQRQAGDALGRFVDSKESRPQGVLSDLAPLFDSILNQTQGALKTGLAETRERASIAGLDRVGTGGMALEMDFANKLFTDLGAEMARIGETARQFDEQSFLQSLGMLQGFGADNLAPILALSQLGILPEEVMQTPGIGSQILGTVAGIGGSILGGPAGGVIANKLFGG